MTDDEILKKWHENKITFELSPYKKIIEFARALLAAGASEGQAAKKKYDASGCDAEESDPVERLRFFCSLAMKNGQDWLDSEPFFDAVFAEIAALRERIAGMEKDADRPVCVDCGDSIMAHDPGVCGNCYSIKYAKEPK